MNMGEERLQDVINNSTTSTTLHTGATPEYAERFVEALKTNTSVKTLILWIENDEGAKLITDVFKVNRTIGEVTLNEASPGLSESGWNILAESLKGNSSINVLNYSFKLDCNFHDESSLRKFAEAIGSNPNLISFKFGNSLYADIIKDVFSPPIIASGSKNILYFLDASDELVELCKKNQTQALWFITKMQNNHHGDYGDSTLQGINDRLPAIKHLAKNELKMSEVEIEDLLKQPLWWISQKGIGAKPQEEPVVQEQLAEPQRKPKISPAEIRAQLKARSGVSVREG